MADEAERNNAQTFEEEQYFWHALSLEMLLFQTEEHNVLASRFFSFVCLPDERVNGHRGPFLTFAVGQGNKGHKVSEKTLASRVATL